MARVKFVLFVLAGCTVWFALLGGFYARSGQAASWQLTARTAGLLLLMAALYLFSHLLRTIRLAVMIRDNRVGIRQICFAHFYSAAVSLLIPFKLGEIYRIIEINRLIGAPARTTLLVWSERVLDLLVLMGTLVVALWFFPESISRFVAGIALTVGVLMGTIVLFFVIPENLDSFKTYVIRRYNAIWSVKVLRILDTLQRVLSQISRMLYTRWATLLSLTVGIWLVDIFTVYLALPSGTGKGLSAMIAVAFFFSSLQVGGQTSLALVAATFGVVKPASQGLLMYDYPAVIFQPLLAIAAVLFVFSFSSRLREAELLPKRYLVSG